MATTSFQPDLIDGGPAPAGMRLHGLNDRARANRFGVGWAVLAALAFWLIDEAIACLRKAAAGQTFPAAEVPAEIMFVIGGTLLCVAVQQVIVRNRSSGMAAKIAAAVAATVVASIALMLYIRLTVTILLPEKLAGRDITLWWLGAETARWLPPFAFWSTLVLVCTLMAQARQREQQLAQALVTSQNAQILALRYQVNPHFLFNTLNSISALVIDGRADRAERMIMKLSSFFRASLALDPMKDVRLDDEIALQQLYLDIEADRFSDRLSVRIDIDPDTRSALIPSLILQPLVENAIKHGFRSADHALFLALRSRRVEDRLVIEIENSARTNSPVAGERIGLNNVARRLALRFGAAAKVEVVAGNGSFLVRLTMPLRSVW